jgi:hypothetical protein
MRFGGPLLVNPPTRLTSGDYLWSFALDGSLSQSGGTQSVSQPRAYVNALLASGAILAMAGNLLTVTTTLTVGDNCILHNDGGNGADNSTVGGSGGGLGGQLGVGNASPGSIGGVATANGVNGTATGNAVGGEGGKGGNGSGGATGGTKGTKTAPLPASVGRWWTGECILEMCAINKGTRTYLNGGTPGGGGAGSSGGDNRVGCGGGQPAGLAQIRARRIVLAPTARISCNGGRGGNAQPGGGGGGGAGGGWLVAFCDDFEGDYDQLQADGGVGGTASGGGQAGDPGGDGIVLIYKRGKLVYASGV